MRWAVLQPVRRVSRPPVLAGLAVAVLAVFLAAPVALRGQDVETGERIYERWCADCHGFEGEGDGPSADWMMPRPRDFVAARYQIRTTPSGQLPTDDDVLRVIREGMPGTAMPGWPNLSSRERADVLAYLKSLSPFFEHEVPEPMDFGRDPGGGEDALESGRSAYVALECDRCHGEAGRGDGPSAPTLEDWREFAVRAVDLTKPWLFDGGGSVEQIHRRLLTGLDGTPMPTQTDAVDAGVVSEEELWHLAHYVASLGSEREPRPREVVRVERTEEALPESADDPAWDDVESFYFPLAGQVIEVPRSFSPTVSGVWVQGLHDGGEMALRLAWNDPSRSPDPSWQEWQERIARTLPDDGVPIPTDPLPDAFALQFPMELPTGLQRPYFLMGDSRRPVYLWYWDSEAGVSERQARGLGNLDPLEAGSLTGSAAYERAQWRLILRRPLDPGDGPGLLFPEGVPIPVAFYAWDGSSGEDATRGSVGSWYYLVLEEPRSPMEFVAPLVVVLLTGGLGIGLARRARSRWRS